PIAWWAFRNGMDYEAWRRYLVFSVISALIPNLLLLLLVLRTISRPLQRITLAAVEVTKGGYGTEVDLRKSNDEIGLLADSFNEMSRKMAADIDELQRLNEQLIRAEKLAAMGTLAAGVAHEVNNPLASISSLVQMMRAEAGHSDETRERLNLISAQIERINQVTKDMTNFARSRPAAKHDVDVNLIVGTAMRLANFDKVFQALDIERDLSDELPAVFADDDQLQQVFLNLLLNARDAMPDGGKLTVRSLQDNGHVTVEIADSGTGIDMDEAKQIFDPFFTTKPAGKGTGLGLAVCYGIVTAHDGRIEVGPNQPQGSVFRVILPVSK
ncbi:MAG TPA: ATP-binding protein, partial [Pyrinomonadaceae bacterium]|nr:ATP-binding protein [Pyrinomonadaceae bacterium]